MIPKPVLHTSDDFLMSEAELGKKIGKSTSTIRRWIREGMASELLPEVTMVNGERRYSQKAYQYWATKNTYKEPLKKAG